MAYKYIYILTYLSGLLSGIYSGILSGIYSDILPGMYSDILSGMDSDILYGIYSGIHSGIYSDIRSDTLSGIFSRFSFWHFSGILSDTCDIRSDNLSDIYSGSLSGILSGIELAIGFGSRRAPLHPELAIWWSGRMREWRGGVSAWVSEWVSERVALLKSRDPYLGRRGKHTLRGS